MATILLTRPEDDNERLGARLEALGYAVRKEPLLRILRLDPPLPLDLREVGAVLLTSRYALAALGERGAALTPFLELPCCVVGERSAAAARAFGFRDVRIGGGKGEDAARLLRDAVPAGTTVLHIAGEDVAGEGLRLLQEAGLTVRRWTVYRAEAATTLTPATQGMMMRQGIQAALFFSPRTARIFAGLVREQGLVAACGSCGAVALSPAVAEALEALPWRFVATASAPDEESLLAQLQVRCPS